jgi:hypothetical protein
MTGIGTAAALAAGIAAFVPATGYAQSTSAVGETPANQRVGAVTLVGCLVRESDYRQKHNLGGGAVGGMGLGDELVIVDTSTTSTTSQATSTNTAPVDSPASPSSSAINCADTGKGPAYRLTGSMEDKLKAFVGRSVEVRGDFEPDRDGESKLPEEVNVRSYREHTAAAETVSSPAVVADVAEVRAEPAPREIVAMVEESRPVEREALPRTASPVPFIGLIGLLSLGSGLWMSRRK